MGNSISTNSLWPPGNLFKRDRRLQNSKKRNSKRTESKKAPPVAPPVAPMYDTVADFPVYSMVDKSRPSNLKMEDNVQYAEIEVIRKPTYRSQKKPALLPKPAESTEYATINFPPSNNMANQYKPPPPTNTTSPHKAPPPTNIASQYKAPPLNNTSRQYNAPAQHSATSPKKFNAINGTLV